MVLGAAGGALAAAAGGVSAIWGYNRDNYMYDREMRQKNEFKVASFRAKQAGLWREDVRDLIALTERKMDSYLIVNTLQLGMCVALFTEGRLEPGTPQWLLRFYMSTLGAAFLYLLMSMWLAMHASVVAQTSGVRLLTQLVRLPIPTWHQLEAMRSYASSFETMGRSMLRIPFISRAPAPMTSREAWAGDGARSRSVSPERCRSPERAQRHCQTKSLDDHKQSHSDSKADCCKKPAAHRATSSCTEAAAGQADKTTSSSGASPDPWDLEKSGSGIYELQSRPNASRPHIGMVRREALHWQCYDSFARVSMSFGTNQLLSAITYYCLGYITIEDGALWPAVCIAAVMGAIAVTLIHLDFSITKARLRTAVSLLLSGPACVIVTTWALLCHSPNAELLSRYLLPVGYLSHGLQLWWSLKALNVEKNVDGAWLPMNFRTVIYLDVFGWFHERHHEQNHEERRSSQEVVMSDSKAPYRSMSCVKQREVSNAPSRVDSISSAPSSPRTFKRHKDKLTRDAELLTKDVELWQTESVQSVMEPQDKERVSRFAEQFHSVVGQEPGSEMAKATATLQSNGELAASGPSSLAPLYAGNTLSASSSAGSKQKAKWVKLNGQSDFGTVVPYLYNPQTGDIREMDRESSSALSSVSRELSLTQTEENITHFIRRADNLRRGQEAQLQAEGAPSSSRRSQEDAKGITVWSCTAKCEDEHESIVIKSPRLMKHDETAAQGPACSKRGDPQPSSVDSQLLDVGVRHMPPEMDHFHGPATDYGKIDPGKLPWLVFRGATLLLVAVWATGPFLSFGLVGGMAEFGSEPMLTGEGAASAPEIDVHGDVSVADILSAAVAFETDGRLPAFAEGEEVRVSWPRGSSFTPRSLSCDPLGKQLVVSDDFGVYSAQLSKVENAGGLDRQHTKRRLRGHESLDSELSAQFGHVLPCTALEGQAVKDIGVVCSEGQPSDCKVLVLHGRGHRLAECPLQTPAPLQVVSFSREMLAKRSRTAGGAERSQVVEPVGEWTIPDSWLNLKEKKEHVSSIAVNNECLSRARMLNEVTFERDMSGCVVVGTTSGRVVQMRRHATQAHQLVPEWNMVQLPHSVGQGSLHVVPGEFVLALHPKASVVRAFDAVKGTVLGSWQLPEEIHWITLCGGGSNIYMLGVRRKPSKTEDSQGVMLWRFPVPPELRVRLLADDSSRGGQEI